MKTIYLEFYECEHSGDLEMYIADVRNCGARIIKQSVDCDAELGYLTIEVRDEKEFWNEFKETDSYGFLN